MSSRFVRGWKAAPASLLKLVGASKLSVKTVLATNKRAAKDVFMTLGQGYERADIAEGKELAIVALTNLLEGKLDADDPYGRVLELILNHVARPLARTVRAEIYLGFTYHVPHVDMGCWNPALRALGLPTLAKLWARGNYPFPRARGTSGGDWPIWSVFDPKALRAIEAELAPLRRATLDAIPAKPLGEDADATRDELWQGLERLRDWVREVQKPERTATLGMTKTGNSLIYVMDGDQ